MTTKKKDFTDADSIMMSARSLQTLVNSFGEGADPSSNILLFKGQFIAAPVLLALAMELALKAWWVRGNKYCDVPKTHDLLKLFDGLSEDTRIKLERAYPEIPHPLQGFQPIRQSLRSLLTTNKTAFVEWRYLHEISGASFPHGEFGEALTAVVNEFIRTLK